jgi:tetratricopeptide (TPR) repeat protein
MHKELAGVASVADQLLASETDLSPRDRAHTQLARAVAHVRNGEAKEGLALLDDAWSGLARWNLMARELAIQTALEAFEHEHIEDWVAQSDLPEPEADVYRAWATLVKGDVMAALEQLAKLPQEHPRVAHLQALALVEQQRFEEAKAWVERTQKLLPPRNDVEVAAARVEAHIGDKKVAVRRLEALAEEEPYAPRAWTGLGEAHLQQEEVDERKARRAFERAIERERKPAEATLQLGKLVDNNRKEDPDAETEALELFEKAADANPHLPRYREQLARYLMDLGYPQRALEILRELADEPGVGWPALLALVELEVGHGKTEDVDALLEKAQKLGADPRAVERERARILLASDDKDKIAEAQTKLAALLNQKPDDVQSRVMLAMAHLRQFDRKGAESVVRRGFATTPGNDQGRLHLAWAQIEARTGKRATAAPRARAAWNRMLDEDRPPRELLEVADLATRLWIRHKRDRVAVTIGKQLTERVPFHSEAWTIRAEAELAAADAGDVLESAERAIELDKDNPRAHALVGHAQLRFGRKDKAKQAYERAIELVEGTPAEKEYRENLRRL